MSTPTADHPALATLPDLIRKQRRALAGQLRITREEKALRDAIDAALAAAGVHELTCEGFHVLRSQGRDGRPTARVTPVKGQTT